MAVDFDLLSEDSHSPALLFYRPPSSVNATAAKTGPVVTSSSEMSRPFFDVERLKECLAKTLVPFYPLAGRLRRNNDDNRVEIDCNGEGVQFVVAKSDVTLDEFGDLAPSEKLFQLVAVADRTGGISSFPLFIAQLTRFKCGAVCLCMAIHRFIVDGVSAFHFINSWSELCRGCYKIKAEPFLDRTLLRPRNPPRPSFDHIEYHPPPTYTNDLQDDTAKTSTFVTHIFAVSSDQLAHLKAQAPGYTTYEVLTAHIWRCSCKARSVPPHHLSKLHITTNARPRCVLKLPATYFGSPQATAVPISTVGKLVDRPLKYAVEVIHDALARVTGEYVKSALDYLALHPNKEALRKGPHFFKGANLTVTSWTTLGAYSCDFGWGCPFFLGRGIIPSEGQAYVIPNASGDGGYTLLVCLQPHHIASLKSIFNTTIYAGDKVIASEI